MLRPRIHYDYHWEDCWRNNPHISFTHDKKVPVAVFDRDVPYVLWVLPCESVQAVWVHRWPWWLDSIEDRSGWRSFQWLLQDYVGLASGLLQLQTGLLCGACDHSSLSCLTAHSCAQQVQLRYRSLLNLHDRWSYVVHASSRVKASLWR